MGDIERCEVCESKAVQQAGVQAETREEYLHCNQIDSKGKNICTVIKSSQKGFRDAERGSGAGSWLVRWRRKSEGQWSKVAT